MIVACPPRTRWYVWDGKSATVMSICVDASLVVRLIADPTDARVTVLWETWNVPGNY